MDAFRNLLRGWVGKALLALIILPFAIVGVEGVFMGGGRDEPAIEIDGKEISKAELDQAVENRRQQLLEQMGGGIDPSLVTAEMVRPATERALIQRQLLIKAAESEGLYVPAETVKSYVRSLPQFHDEKGLFSQQKLESFLAQAGLTTTKIFQEISTDMLTDQLQTALVQSAFATPQDVDRILALDRQTRDISVGYIKPETFEPKLTIAEDDLLAFFEKHESEFKSDERVQLEYLHFSKQDFVDQQMPVSDEQIAAKLAEKTERAKQSERRRAAHILIETGVKHSEDEAKTLAESLLAQIKGGKAFETLAKEASEDISTAEKGGDLGFAGKGVYDPAFEAALYAIPSLGGISEIVKTEFGYHIIKLLEVDSAVVPDPTRDREAIIAEIREDQAREKMALAVDELNRLSFETGDLSVIAEQYQKTVQTSGWVTRSSGEGYFSQSQVREIAFSDLIIQEQRNSESIELDDGSLLLIRLKVHEAPRQLTLNEVKDIVRQRTLAAKAREKAETVAEEILDKLRNGSLPEEAVKDLDVAMETHSAVQRTTDVLDRKIIQKAFELAKPQAGKFSSTKLNLENGDLAVLAVSNVGVRAADRSEAEKKQFTKGMAYRFGSTEMEGYLGSLESKADIMKYESDATK